MKVWIVSTYDYDYGHSGEGSELVVHSIWDDKVAAEQCVSKLGERGEHATVSLSYYVKGYRDLREV